MDMDSATMLSMCKEVLWNLDDGTGQVHVVGARGAKGLVLTVGSEIFEESGAITCKWNSRLSPGFLGLRGLSLYFPTGTLLAVVGESLLWCSWSHIFPGQPQFCCHKRNARLPMILLIW